MTPTTIPHGRTALRLEWRFLPPHVRALVERRLGSPVVAAESQDSGHTAAFASVLTCADGTRHFVKAASRRAQRAAAASYLSEATVLAALPPGALAPEMRWRHLDDDWIVLGLEYVDATAPARPWQPDELERCLDALESLAEAMPGPPTGLDLTTFAEDFADAPASWDVLRRRGTLHASAAELDEAEDLALGFDGATAGDAVLHTDLRADNLLLDRDGAVRVCDWAFPALGAPWVDTVLLLVGAHADGVDAEAHVAQRPLTRHVPPEHVDALLALVSGHQLRSAGDPAPSASPYLRHQQAEVGGAAWDWLARRRGWGA